MKRLFVIALVLTVAVMLAGAGCKSIQQQAAEKQAEKILEKATGENIEVGSLPSDFPSDIPIYPGSSILTSSIDTETENAYATLQTDDSTSKVTEWYKSNLESKGWTVTSTSNFGEMNSIDFEKGNKWGSVSVASADGKTTISLGTYTK